MDSKTKLLNLKLFSSLGISAVFLSGCTTFSDYSYNEYQRGKADAQRDIQADHLVIEVYGFGASNDSEWGRSLKERYGIEQRVVAGCIVNEKIVGHAKGYNEISHAEIERRLGKHIWNKIFSEERAYYEVKSPALRSLE